MKRAEIFLSVLILGSLWGFFEMMALPIYVLCAVGLFFLVLGRQIANIPGTSILIGLIVCFYKTYSDHFFICQWAGVMALAGSFELFASLVFRDNLQKITNGILIGFLTNLIAFPVFIVFVTFILREPNWISDGSERIINYGIQSVLPAAIFSGLITTPLGLLAGMKISKLHLPLERKFIPGVYLIAIMLLWIAASINKM